MIKFILDSNAGIPYYRQIIDQIKYGIASGKLKAGEQLPTVRALSQELKINLNTVTKAYRELEVAGVITTQQGVGTFINKTDPGVSSKEKKKKLKNICSEFLTVAHSYGFTKNDVIAELQKVKEK